MNVPPDIELLQRCCERGRNCCVGLEHANTPQIYKGEQLTRYVLGKQKKACDCFDDDTRVVLVVLSRTLDYSNIGEYSQSPKKATTKRGSTLELGL